MSSVYLEDSGGKCTVLQVDRRIFKKLKQNKNKRWCWRFYRVFVINSSRKHKLFFIIECKKWQLIDSIKETMWFTIFEHQVFSFFTISLIFIIKLRKQYLLRCVLSKIITFCIFVHVSFPRDVVWFNLRVTYLNFWITQILSTLWYGPDSSIYIHKWVYSMWFC